MEIYTLISKEFGKCYFFSNIGVGDIPVDGFFNTNFTFSKLCGGRISELKQHLDHIEWPPMVTWLIDL